MSLIPQVAANLNEAAPQRCLTDDDRALLQAVTGWHVSGASAIVPVEDAAGRTMLIPLLAWVIADARRSGALHGDVTPGVFERAVAAVNRSHSSSLWLNGTQIGQGFRHLRERTPRSSLAAAGPLSADRALAAAG
jgi:hypothetical protein